MTEQLIDLTEVDFWLICFLSVIVVTPLVRADARRVIWALVNVLFLYLLLGWNSIGILVVIPVLYVFIRGVASAYRASFTVLTAALIASLFFLHKLPLVTEGIGVGLLGDVLSIIGFSYVALRMIELLRAVFEGRHLHAIDAPRVLGVTDPTVEHDGAAHHAPLLTFERHP